MPRRIEIIVVPYDSGVRAERMGKGPLHLLEAGIAPRLAADGHEVGVTMIETKCAFRIEAAVAVDLQRQVAEAVRAARGRGAWPLVLSGNCNTALGTLTALGTDVGAIWFDAHGDFNTPDTSPSGFVDGMALAMATGRCWQALTASIDGFAPIADERVILVGARALDPGERELLEQSRVAKVTVDAIRSGGIEALDRHLDALALRGVTRIYLHLDLDVHDPAEAPANAYPAADGLSCAEVRGAVDRIAARFSVGAVTLAAYDPSVDGAGRTADAAIRLARALAQGPTPE